jgi:hypothetical protein
MLCAFVDSLFVLFFSIFCAIILLVPSEIGVHYPEICPCNTGTLITGNDHEPNIRTEDGSGSLLDTLHVERVQVRAEEACLLEPNSIHNPNEIFGTAELWLVRLAVFVIFLIGLYKVVADTLRKILK